MRSEWKESEKVALQLLSDSLRSRGIPPIYCPDITDSPDALFIVDGHCVAIECRYIANPELLKFLGKHDLIPDVAYEVVVPREPHLWVRDAIAVKNMNVEKYKANAGATDVWLLLHSSKMHSMLTGDDSDKIFKTLLSLGTHLTPHNFTRIWFAETGHNPLEAIEIFGSGIPKPVFDWDAYVKEFLPSYPHDTKWFISAILKDGPADKKIVSVNLNDERAKPVGLQPLDKNYKLDYSYLANALRNANKIGLNFCCTKTGQNTEKQ